MEWISGNVFIRPNGPYSKGHIVLGHAHNFDHTTIIMKGSFHIKEVGGRDIIVTAPAHLLIKRGVFHEITALEEDSTFWCIYSHRNPQGEIVLDYDGWRPAYETTTTLRPD